MNHSSKSLIKNQVLSAKKFQLPSNYQLSTDNRWIIMASLIPWSEFEKENGNLFSAERGAPALSFRIALGAKIIKEKLGHRM